MPQTRAKESGGNCRRDSLNELLENCRRGDHLRGLSGTSEGLGPEQESGAASPVRARGGPGMWEPHSFV